VAVICFLPAAYESLKYYIWTLTRSVGIMYKNKDLEIIIKVILAEIEPSQIILFGSYARGDQHELSDIDLMILTEENISRTQKLELIYKLQKAFLDLNYKIDLVLKNLGDYNKYKNYIGTINYSVSQKGKVLWTRQ
jgi:uncharacterized protein